MFLSNQKYREVEYKLSEELGNHLQSIKNFLTNLIITNPEEFKIIDIGKEDILTTEEQESYKKGESLDEITKSYLSISSSNLVKELKKTIDSKFDEEVTKHKDCLFLYGKKIFYIKKRQNEERTIVTKLNNKLKKELDTEIKDVILTFWQQHINNKSTDILKVFIEHKSNDISLIEDNNVANSIDFLPIKIESLDADIQYDKNEKNIVQSQLQNINTTFDINISFKPNMIISEALVAEQVIGLVIDEYLFFYNIYPLIKNRTFDSLKTKLKYLKNSILTEDAKQRGDSEKIKEFKLKNIDNTLLEILAKLEENIYVKKEHFDKVNQGVAEPFFESSYLVETKYLKYNQFFIPFCEESTTLFGLHNNNNARNHLGQGEKGLKSWVNTKNEEQNMATNERKTKAEQVMHLLPELAFYFKEKFFEDLLEAILIEIKAEEPSLNLDIVVNKVFYINKNKRITTPLSQEAKFETSQEFDFIVSYKKVDGSIATIILEAKTKLSKFIIQDQAEKVEKYIDYDDLNIFEKYCLIGFNVDKNVNSSMSYFIKNMPVDEAEGLAFEYPLPTTESSLYCMASNNRTELKNNLKRLFT